MNTNIPTPLLPAKVTVLPKSNVLKIEQLQDSLYDPMISAFFGGKFKTMSLTKDGFPVWIKVENNRVVITQLINCIVDKETDTYVGGEEKILLELELK